MLFLVIYLLLKSPWWSFRSTDTMSLPNKPMWPLITPFREVPQVNKSLECSRHDDSYAVRGCGVNCAVIVMTHECLLRLALAWPLQWKRFFFIHVSGLSQRDLSGLVGETIFLPCDVDTEKCGDLHSIKWYRGSSRIFVFSEMAGIARAEGDYTERWVRGC